MNLSIVLIQIVFILTFKNCIEARATAMDECGKPETEPNERIIGGSEVSPHSWPWIVSINIGGVPIHPSNNRGGHFCGGVLINREWVLTAAHCLDDEENPNDFPILPPSEWEVTAGVHNRDINSPEVVRWQRRGVRQFFPNPNFRDLGHATVNDIALLQLDYPVTFNAFVKPICLPNRRVMKPNQNGCFTAGWGATSDADESYSMELQAVEIPFINYWSCRIRYGSTYNYFQHLCGGDWFHGTQDSCNGDSGGPLACQRDDGSWYLAGVISWGQGCGRAGTPGVYTKVRFYQPWILSVLLEHSPETVRQYHYDLLSNHKR